MINDILYKTDVLNGLFTKKDLEFLKENSNKQKEIEFAIKMADLKKEKVIEYIKKIDIESEKIKNIDQDKLKEYVDNAEKAFESINSIIRNLTNILDEFKEIEKEILELVVKKESHKDEEINNIIRKIDNKIYNFQNNKKNIEKQNKEYSILVDKFLNKAEIDKIFEQENNSIKEKSKIYNTYNEDLQDNLELRVSERHKRVYLPYTKNEVEEFLNNYPEEYETAEDVIQQDFISDISIYNKHPVLARFREAYSLSRNREMKSVIDSLKFAMDMMFRSELNPTIIAAVKSQKQLENYIECLETNKLENFKYFKIIFEVNPI